MIFTEDPKTNTADFTRAREAIGALVEPLPLPPEYDIFGHGGPVTIEAVISLLNVYERLSGMDDESVLFGWARALWESGDPACREAAQAICAALEFKPFGEDE